MIAGVLASLLTACAGSTGDTDSPAYRLGFNDGCTTASGEASGAPKTPQRNAVLYEGDPDYRAGWGSGHVFCRVESTRRTPF